MNDAVALLARAQRGILLAVPPEPTADTFAAGVALALALENAGKSVTLVSPSHVPSPLHFLPGTSQVQEAVTLSPELRLDVPTGGAHPRDVHWEVVGDTLRITVHPPRGRPLPTGEVRVQHGTYPWDLIVCVGAQTLHRLGELFTAHTAFFYATPILNIDRGASNEFYGAVNLVPAHASTLAEVVAELLDTLGGVNLLTPDVATTLLAGIISGTDSFRSPTTSPRTFQTASRLVAQEADHSMIVHQLFQTHTLEDLRLFGRVLTRIAELPLPPSAESRALLASSLAHGDFTDIGTTPDATPRVFAEVLAWVGSHRPFVLAFERRTGSLEALVALGRVSADDRTAFAAATRGVPVGAWVLVNLGAAAVADAHRHITEHLIPRLPGIER